MTMREITNHQNNECNSAIRITTPDHPSGVGHHYHLAIPNHTVLGGESATIIQFQDGPIKEVGTNGLTHEALLAILIDRLQGFQSGPYACRENAIALTKLQEAKMWLEERTRGRMARGVEGTHEK